jgi:hypothetical protein
VHIQRIAVLITATVGVVASMLLPWYYIVGPVPGYAGDGWGSGASFAVVVLLSVIGNRRQAMRGLMLWAVIAGAIAAILFVLRYALFVLLPNEPNASGFQVSMYSALALVVLSIALKGVRPWGKPES